jgi:hypothetical protein
MRRNRSSQAERQLVLLSAGTAARRRELQQHASTLAALSDWGAMTETLRSRRLLTVLGPRIVELAGEQAREPMHEALAQALSEGRRQGAFLQLIAARIAARLAAAGIRCTPLKGPGLGEQIYGDIGRRPSSDIDLLVAPQQLRDAVEVVRELGYEVPADHLDRSGLPTLHLAMVHERRQLPAVELHWRIHWYERRYASERLLAPTGQASPAWQPNPDDGLAALLLFYARDGFVDLRLAADIGAWWDRFGADIAPGTLARLSHGYPELARALTASSIAAERLVGLPARELLSPRRKLGLRGRTAVRLANPNPRASLPQLYADIGMVDALLMPAGGLPAFVRRQLLPPREVLDGRVDASDPRRGPTPLGHGSRVLARYALSAARLTRPPEALRLP